MNQTYPGCDNEYTDFCIQTRLITACLLLRDMNCEDMVTELLADRSAMERLAQHPWDCIEIATQANLSQEDLRNEALSHGLCGE